MGDRPSRNDLLRAVSGFLENELMPGLEGVQRFHTRVAVNALGIVIRELENEQEQLPERHSRLCALLEREPESTVDPEELNRHNEAMEVQLCQRIRSGAADESSPWRERLLEHLRLDVAERLAIANPGYR
ncbi:MAG: hypothetical protein GY725_02165 [bacterium]|nr:hypothetical protein [bacterium]